MANQTTPAFLPKYVRKFQCVGAECLDTCCAGWTVILDKKTYKRYKSMVLRGSASEIRSNLKPIEGPSRNDQSYGRIVMRDDGSCPFLSEKKLCGLQSAFGPSVLSPTCASYPRHTACLENMAQEVLTPSCPEVARLLSQDSEAVELEIGHIDAGVLNKNQFVNFKGIDADAASRIRFGILNIVRDKSIPLWNRLGAIAYVCEALDRLSKAESLNAFADAIEVQENVANFYAVSGYGLASLGNQADIAHKFFKLQNLSGRRLSAYQQSALVGVFDLLAKAASCGDEQAFVAECYETGLKKLSEVLRQNGHIMTNYVVNLLMMRLFPWDNSGDSCQDQLYKIAVRLGILRFILALNARSKGSEFNKDDVINLIAVFTRLFEHNQRHRTAIDEAFASLRESVPASPQAVIGLIRDDL